LLKDKMVSNTVKSAFFLALMLVAINCTLAYEDGCKNDEDCTLRFEWGFTCDSEWAIENCCETCPDSKVNNDECVDGITRCNELKGLGFTCEDKLYKQNCCECKNSEASIEEGSSNVAINYTLAYEDVCKDHEFCAVEKARGYTCAEQWITVYCCETCHGFKVKDGECVHRNDRCYNMTAEGETCENEWYNDNCCECTNPGASIVDGYSNVE